MLMFTLCLLPFASATEPLPGSAAPIAATLFSVEPRSFSSSTLGVAPAEDRPEMEYTYIEANYVWLDSDLLGDTLDGYEVTGSLELPLNFFLQATGRDQSADASVTTYRIGAGWHFGFTAMFDAYGILSYENVQVDDSGDDFTGEGAAGEIGLRFLPTKRIELNGRAQYVDSVDGEAGFGLGARFYFTESLSAGLRFDAIGDDTLGSAGLRFEF